MSIPKANAGKAIKLVKAPGVAPQAAAAGTITGTVLDVRGWESAVISVLVGATSGAPDSFTVDCTVEYSLDGTTAWTALTPATPHPGTTAAATAQITAVNTEKHLDVNLNGAGYIRVLPVVAFVNGTSPKVGLAVAIALLGGTNIPPAAY